jgi:hypothetical protein
MELVKYIDAASRNCTAVILERGRKYLHVALVEADGYHKAKLPLNEERFMRPLETTRRTVAAVRRIAKRTSNRTLRKQIIGGLK